MIKYEKALSIIKKQANQLGTETVLAKDAYNRILSYPVISQECLPPFDNSAMDGFALPVQPEEIQPGAEFEVIGQRAADVTDDSVTIHTGKCMQIMTGAVLPEGSDRVIPIEQVKILETTKNNLPARIKITETIKTNAHVRRRGEDVTKNDCVIEQGVKIKSAHLAMLAAIGTQKVTVQKRPKVALICTGNELVNDARQELKPGQIRNSNAPLLCARIKESGADLVVNKTIGDDTKAFNNFLISAKEKDADIIISCGAVSMGKFDFIPKAIEQAGGKIHFHKAAIRPGKPILFASFPGDVLYFGLPGNPVSSAVGLRFFVTPALRKQMNLEAEIPMKLPLVNEFAPHPFLRFFLKAKIEFSENGKAGVRILSGQQSFKIRPLLEANCWASIPPGASPVQKGELVDVYWQG